MKTEAVYKESKSAEKAESSKKSEVKDDFNRTDETVSIRKISNGYVAKKCWKEGKGNKMEYKEEEIYYAENPL